MIPPSPTPSTSSNSPPPLTYSSDDGSVKFEESFDPKLESEYILEVCPQLCNGPKSRPMWLESHPGSSEFKTMDVSFIGNQQDIQLETLGKTYWTNVTWNAKNTEKIKGSRRTYKAELQLRSDLVVKAVLKFGMGYDEREELENEADLYSTKLEGAQGRIVPKFVGIFGCQTPKRKGRPGYEITTCLVLFYMEGNTISTPFSKLSAENR